MVQQTDVLILGCGISGCSTALALAERGVSVTLVSSSRDLTRSNSYWGQGGIIFSGKEDSPDLLTKDLMEAGAGLCNQRAVEQLVQLGPQYVDEVLIKFLGVDFDRTEGGDLALTEEAAHSCPRILHHRDQTGSVILDAMLQKLQSYPDVQILGDHTAVDLITLSHHSTRLTDIY
ncbi:MAG: FAD-dependent oxidoreductase, partial [Chlamydiia bacterium]|nr:FAD-dependent oxidoreductase [Chlamydiia bacterium]